MCLTPLFQCSGDNLGACKHFAAAVMNCGQGYQLLQILQSTMPPEAYKMFMEYLPKAQAKYSRVSWRCPSCPSMAHFMVCHWRNARPPPYMGNGAVPITREQICFISRGSTSKPGLELFCKPIMSSSMLNERPGQTRPSLDLPWENWSCYPSTSRIKGNNFSSYLSRVLISKAIYFRWWWVRQEERDKLVPQVVDLPDLLRNQKYPTTEL